MASPTIDATTNLVWHKQVPLKVFIVAWRLLKNRLPTKLNLQRCGIAQVTDTMCVSGCGKDESASHLFLHCHVYGSLWQHIRSWIGVSSVDTENVCEHFHQFFHYSGYSKARRSFLQLLWLLCIWLVWNERNNRLFNNTKTPIEQLLKANKTTFVYGSQSWWYVCLTRMGIDWLYFVIILCDCLSVGLDPLVHGSRSSPFIISSFVAIWREIDTKKWRGSW